MYPLMINVNLIITYKEEVTNVTLFSDEFIYKRKKLTLKLMFPLMINMNMILAYKEELRFCIFYL